MQEKRRRNAGETPACRSFAGETAGETPAPKSHNDAVFKSMQEKQEFYCDMFSPYTIFFSLENFTDNYNQLISLEKFFFS